MGDRGGLGESFNVNPRYGYLNKGIGPAQRKRPKPVSAPYDLEEGPLDHQDADKQVKLYEENVGVHNHATNRKIVERAQQAVLASMKDVYNVMEFLRNKWLILYRLYRGETISQFQYGRGQIHSPEPYKVVETIHPRVMRALFGFDPWFKFYGKHHENDVYAQNQEVLCKQQLREMEYLKMASRFIRSGLIYGTAIQKLWWKQEIKEVTTRKGRRVPDPKFPGNYTVELDRQTRNEVVFDGNFIQQVSIFDWYAPPTASSIQEAEWCGDRSMWPGYRVREMGERGHWVNLEKLKDQPGQNDANFGDEYKERKAYSYGVFDSREASGAPHVPHYTVLDWYGPLDLGNGKEVLCNVVMIEPNQARMVVRVTELPFWHQKLPYQAWRWVELEEEMYGIGALEMIARLSMEKDTKRNLLMAATQLEANPMFLVSDEANIPDGQLIAQPGLCLRVPDVQNSMAPLHVPNVSDSALKAENVLTQDIRETAGTTSPMMSAQAPFGSGKTATQHTSEIDEANTRLLGGIANYERDVTEPMLNQMSWNNQQFMSYPKAVRDIGPQGLRWIDRYQIAPEDILGQFLIQPLSSFRLTTRTLQVQQLTNILDRAPIINQMYGPQTVNMPKLLAKILQEGFDFRDVADYIKLPPMDSGLLTAIEEHELWYHGVVPARHVDDNDVRHYMAHEEEIRSERFALLEATQPSAAAKARAHAAEHARKMALLQEIQEQAIMLATQQQQVQGPSAGTGGGGAGAAGVGQEPGSPKVRREAGAPQAGEEGESEGSMAASNAGVNAGAS
jgi:hypothetical protein